MIFPFRSKNPPEHFPYCTIALIIINVVIYLLTTTNRYFLAVDESALNAFAVTHNNLSILRLTTAMFLHANLEHIFGNMLFLWIFGAAAEGRLRPPRFLIIYFFSGWTGGILSDLIHGQLNPDAPSLGASGAIMGVAGAYLFMFPFARIRLFYILPLGYFWRFGLADWQAMYVVLLYIGIDFLFGVILKRADGVGHFAHLGGFGTGLLGAVIMRARRDTAEISAAQAVLDETKRDYTALGFAELEAMLQSPSENMDLVLAFCERSLGYPDPARAQKCVAYINYYGARLFAQADPTRLAGVLLALPPSAGEVPPVFYLRLGSRLEAITSNSLAVQIYRRIYDLNPTGKDTEMALYRSGQVLLNAFQDRQNAAAVFSELLRLFPHGDMALQARRALQQMGR